MLYFASAQRTARAVRRQKRKLQTMIETTSKKRQHEDDIYTSVEKSLASWRDAITAGGITVLSSGSANQQAEQGAPVETTVERSENQNTDSSGDISTNYSSAVIEFQQRLRTFKTDTYFAKPECVSPLIAARFGWKNTARDILTCANPNCSTSLCINFGKVIRRPQAMRQLCAHYRKQFALGHTKNCLFRYDAQRLLLQEPSESGTVENITAAAISTSGADVKDTASSTIVPPYLLSVSPEMIVFENQSNVEIQIQLIYQTILQRSAELDSALVRFQSMRTNENEGTSQVSPRSSDLFLSFGVIVPESLRFFIKEQRIGVGNDNDLCAASYLLSLLNEWCVAEQTKAEDETIDETSRFQTQESILLAVLGWSLVPSPTGASTAVRRNCHHVVVECPCCLSRALVPVISSSRKPFEEGDTQSKSGEANSGSDESQLHGTAKRQKVLELGGASSRGLFWRTSPKPGSSLNSAKVNAIPDMDPLKSHRYFCPYVGGSLLPDPSFSRRNNGWQIIVKRMLEWKDERQQSSK